MRKYIYSFVACVVCKIVAGGYFWLSSENGLNAKTNSQPNSQISGIATVTDGDSLKIGKYVKIRLFGIDAPEYNQTCQNSQNRAYQCGQMAKDALFQMVNNKKVSCKAVATDKYNRILAICFLDGLNLNQWLVLEGYAFAYRNHKGFRGFEQQAKRNKKGIFQGDAQYPWEFRAENR